MSLKQKILIAVMGVGLTLSGAAAASAAPYHHRMHYIAHHRIVHRHVVRSDRR